jgi:ATP-dependent DNA helicase RecG
LRSPSFPNEGEQEEYPTETLREILLNALIHRNYMGAPTQIRIYDDSLSVWNDGNLPEGIAPDDLKKTHPSIPRTPLLSAYVLREDILMRGETEWLKL